jgi:acetyl-CoA synthetase
MAETKTALIKKSSDVPHHVADYNSFRQNFSWDRIAAEIGKAGDLNMARIAIDRHVEAGRGDTTAIRWLGVDNSKIDISYAELQQQTNRFANALASLGVARGEKVFALSGRLPGLYVSALGTLRHGAVFSSLFSAFGPDPIATRMTIGKAKVLVTTADLYETKVAGIRDRLPDLKHVILLREGGAKADLPGTLDFDELLAAQSDSYITQTTSADTPALLHFTSGTTGKPKGAQHVHGAIIAHYATSRAVLDRAE